MLVASSYTMGALTMASESHQLYSERLLVQLGSGLDTGQSVPA